MMGPQKNSPVETECMLCLSTIPFQPPGGRHETRRDKSVIAAAIAAAAAAAVVELQGLDWVLAQGRMVLSLLGSATCALGQFLARFQDS